MTDDPAEFLLRSIHSDWKEDPSYAWPAHGAPGMRPAPLGGDPLSGAALPPRVSALNRSQTIDAVNTDSPIAGTRTPRAFTPTSNIGLPPSAVNSPRVAAADEWASRGPISPNDWPASDLSGSGTWIPPRRAATQLARAPGRPDPLTSALGAGPLSTSPDDDVTSLHQQQNAEASVAMALGDDLPGSRTLSMSPTSISRIGAPGELPSSPSPTERELARQMRSLTLPGEIGAEAGDLSGPLLRDAPTIASPTAFSPPQPLRGGRPEPFYPRKPQPPRHHTLNLLDQNVQKAASHAFPVLPSGPFGPQDARAPQVASPTSEYGANPLFSPPYSPEGKTAFGRDEVAFGMFAPPPQGIDQGMYFGSQPVASPRQGKSGGESVRPAWFGAPGTLRLGDLTQPPDETYAPELNGAPFVPAPYPYPPPFPPRPDVRMGRGPFAEPPPGAALSSPVHDTFPRRHASGRRGASDAPRHRNRHHHDERTHEAAHEFGNRFELHDVLGRMVEISTDQHGSRLIQEKLDHCSQEERDMVFAELYPEARRLMTDVFGNYVIQKMLEYGSPEQVHALGQQLQGHVLSLSLGTYGCRVVQKAFEHVSSEQKVVLSRELEPYVLDCVRDQNANHVIQKILERVPSAHLDSISSAFAGHVPALASHCYSCRVLQRIFAYCSEAQRRPLLEEMHQDTLRLMQDQYGNYVIQWVLQKGEQRDRIEIVRKTKTHLLQLARHKFASNVVEHVIEVAPPADLADLLDELFEPIDTVDASTAPPLPEGAKHCVATLMMQDQYANYVLQRFLQVVQGEGRQRLIATIKPALQALRQMATPVSGPSAPASFSGAIRLPGGGHVGSKPLLTIERLIDQVSHTPERAPITQHRANASAPNTNA